MANSIPSRRSAANVIFSQLKDEIMALDILPGTKLSEAEVAAKFGVSRQPVREALNLLYGEDLVSIQPQRATRVRRFSMQKITAARFARLAIEIEVIKNTCKFWSELYRPGLERCLDAQDRAVAEHDEQSFHALDEEFHALLSEAGQVPFAFHQIRACKAQVNRICVLSLKQTSEMADLVQDHRTLFDCVRRGDATAAEVALRAHLSRIDKTIAAVRDANAEYFED